MSHRECDNPKPSDALKRCQGSSIKVELCDDAQICSGKSRSEVVEFASQQCAKFNQHVPVIDPNGKGIQASYSTSMHIHHSNTRQTLKVNNKHDIILAFCFYRPACRLGVQNGRGNRAPFSANGRTVKDFTHHGWNSTALLTFQLISLMALGAETTAKTTCTACNECASRKRRPKDRLATGLEPFPTWTS